MRRRPRNKLLLLQLIPKNSLKDQQEEEPVGEQPGIPEFDDSLISL